MQIQTDFYGILIDFRLFICLGDLATPWNTYFLELLWKKALNNICDWVRFNQRFITKSDLHYVYYFLIDISTVAYVFRFFVPQD